MISLGDSLVASRQRRCSHLWLGRRCKGEPRHTVVVAVVYWAVDAEASLTRKSRECCRLFWTTTARTVTNRFGLMRQALLLDCKRYIANELAMADLDQISQPTENGRARSGPQSHSLTSNAEEGPERSVCSPPPTGLPPKSTVAKRHRVGARAYLPLACFRYSWENLMGRVSAWLCLRGREKSGGMTTGLSSLTTSVSASSAYDDG